MPGIMKTLYFLVAGALTFVSVGFAHGASDYYLKLGGVEGESSASATTTTGVQTIQAQPSPSAGGTEDINIGVGELQESGSVRPATDVAAPSTGTTKGKVEYEWKVEEGESAAPNPSIEPDEIDVADDGEPITPDFSILLGGGGGSDDDEAAEESRANVADILRQGAEEAGLPTESISLNFEKITTKVKQSAKFLWFIPASVTATVEIDAENRVQVKFPWWAFFLAGKNGDELGEKVFTTLSNVLKTKHDTVKNAIGNIR